MRDSVTTLPGGGHELVLELDDLELSRLPEQFVFPVPRIGEIAGRYVSFDGDYMSNVAPPLAKFHAGRFVGVIVSNGYAEAENPTSAEDVQLQVAADVRARIEAFLTAR